MTTFARASLLVCSTLSVSCGTGSPRHAEAPPPVEVSVETPAKGVVEHVEENASEQSQVVAHAREILTEATRLQDAKEFSAARERAVQAVDLVLGSTAAKDSKIGTDFLHEAAMLTERCQDLPTTKRARECVLAYRTRTLPDDHPDLQRARQNLAVTIRVLGDLHGAYNLEKKVLEVRTRTLPDDHPDVQRARQNFAGTIKALGDLQGARILQEKVLEVRLRTLPDDHPDVQRARQSLASTMKSLGDLQGAKVLEEKVLEVRTRTLPDDNPELQAIRVNLASTKAQLGDLEGARALEVKALEVYERTFPDDHPELQRARIVLALTLDALGDLSGARTLEEKVLAIDSRTLPDDHPDLQNARLNYAGLLQELGDLQGSRVLLEKLLDVFSRSLPEDHPDVQSARINLATTIQLLGDLQGARALAEKVLEVRARTLPDDNPGLQVARGNLAVILGGLGDYAGAKELEEKQLEVFERTLPEDHRDLQAARLNLAGTMKELGDLPRARELEQQAVEVFARTLPEDHPDLQRSRLRMADTLEALGDRKGARELEEKVVEVFSRILPKDHRDLQQARLMLAWTLASMDEGAGSRQLLSDVLEGLELTLDHARDLSSRERQEDVQSAAWMLSSLLSLVPRLHGTESLERRVLSAVEYAREVSASTAPHLGASADADVRDLFHQERDLRSRLNDAVAGAGSSRAGSQSSSQDIARLVADRDKVEAEIDRRLSGRNGRPSHREVADMARSLGKQARAVGYRRYQRIPIDPKAPGASPRQECLLATVLAPDGTLSRVELGPIDTVTAAVERWRSAVGSPIARGVSPSKGAGSAEEDSAGDALRRLVWDPLVAALGGADDVFVCLDDALLLVPIDALPCQPVTNSPGTNSPGESSPGDSARSSSPRLLGERWRIHSEPSFGSILQERIASTGAPSLLAVGGVNFNAEVGSEVSTPELEAAAPVLAAARSRSSEKASGEVSDADRSGPLGKNWGPLPQTRAEAESIGALFEEALGGKGVVLTGKDATKRALVERSRGVRFLHVATHGYFAPESVRSIADPPTPKAQPTAGSAAARNPALMGSWKPSGFSATVTGLAPMTLCGLALAGANRGADDQGHVLGVLTAEELAGLDLSSCELAVLSACETNVGTTRAGQGMQSLQAALHAAGVGTAITSLWKVDDEKTRELFEDFYTRIWVQKEPKASALWAAKMALRKQGVATRDWAGWILTGAAD